MQREDPLFPLQQKQARSHKGIVLLTELHCKLSTQQKTEAHVADEYRQFLKYNASIK